MATESFRDLNRLRRARNAFEHLRAFAHAHGMADPDSAARETVERVHSVSMDDGIRAGGGRREEPSSSAARGGGGSPEKKRSGRRSSSAPGSSARSGAGQGVPRRLDDRTREQLYARAKQLDIEGRSSMTKEELIEAIREKQ